MQTPQGIKNNTKHKTTVKRNRTRNQNHNLLSNQTINLDEYFLKPKTTQKYTAVKGTNKPGLFSRLSVDE